MLLLAARCFVANLLPSLSVTKNFENQLIFGEVIFYLFFLTHSVEIVNIILFI